MHCEHTNNARSTIPQLFDLKVFQTTPDHVGVGSFPEVRPKDAKDRRIRRSRRPVFGGAVGSAILQHQRALFSESGHSRAVGHHWVVPPIHTLIPFP